MLEGQRRKMVCVIRGGILNLSYTSALYCEIFHRGEGTEENNL